MEIPPIALEQIINYCGKNIYEQGATYTNTDALFIRYKESMALKALCEGLSWNYYLTVQFDNQRIIGSSCTCKKTSLGPCEHIAALLIAWHTAPGAFPERTELDLLLKSYSKHDLVMLIQKIVNLYDVSKGKECFIAFG